MASLKFKATIRDGGNSSILTVPKSFIDGGMVILGKEYTVVLEEVHSAE